MNDPVLIAPIRNNSESISALILLLIFLCDFQKLDFRAITNLHVWQEECNSQNSFVHFITNITMGASSQARRDFEDFSNSAFHALFALYVIVLRIIFGAAEQALGLLFLACTLLKRIFQVRAILIWLISTETKDQQEVPCYYWWRICWNKCCLKSGRTL